MVRTNDVWYVQTINTKGSSYTVTLFEIEHKLRLYFYGKSFKGSAYVSKPPGVFVVALQTILIVAKFRKK
jgi:hypothetical protein